MGIRRVRACDQRRDRFRRALAADCAGSRGDRDQMTEQVQAIRREIVTYREQVLVALRVDERNLRAAQRRLAQAMREQRYFLAQVRADDERARHLLQLRDRATKRGIERIVRVIAEVAATQTMIEIGAAEAAHQPRQQMEFLERRSRRSERTELRAAMLLDDFAEPLGGDIERGFPI